jgi:hypothetical protein
MGESNEWKHIIIEKLVMCGILRKEHEMNPRLAVDDLLAWEVSVALDPAVSDDARRLLYTTPSADLPFEEQIV